MIMLRNISYAEKGLNKIVSVLKSLNFINYAINYKQKLINLSAN